MDGNSNILISIIVPVYNVEKEIDKCIKSLINQTYENVEIILVNDGSTDSSLSICNSYKNKDFRIKVINKENGGLSDARNSGINISTGDYILFVDSDDWIEIDSCEKFISTMDGRNIDIVVGEAKKIEGANISYLKHNNLNNGQEYSSKEYIKLAIEALEWYAPVCFNMYNRDFIIKNELFFKKDILHEDMQILPRTFLESERIIYMQYCFYNYKIREGSITQSKDNTKNIESMTIIFNEWKKTFDEVSDIELRRLLYGILIKQYLYVFREFDINNFEYSKILNNKFLFKYALSNREKIKVILYILAPKVYKKIMKV